MKLDAIFSSMEEISDMDIYIGYGYLYRISDIYIGYRIWIIIKFINYNEFYKI